MRCALLHACPRMCAGARTVLVANPCLGLFFPDFVGNMLHEAIHLQVMVWSHWCCALHNPQASPWLTRFIPYLAENSFITKKWEKKPPVNSKELCRNFIRFKITRKTTQHDSTILLVNYTDECIYFFWIKKKKRISDSSATNTSLYVLKNSIVAREQQAAHLWKLLHHDERQPTQLQIADEHIFSQGAAPVSGLHVGLTENVEQVFQLILVQQAFLLRN